MTKNPTAEKEIEKAVIMMVECIKGGCRNQKPLIMHCMRVGIKLFEMEEPKEVVMAGFLHDLLEDTDCTKGQIRKRFGSRVAKLVSALTFDASIKDYQKRWRKAVRAIKKRGREAMLIKIIDASDNIAYLPLLKDRKRLDETKWKHQLLITSFRKEMMGTKVFKEYWRTFKKVYKNRAVSL